MFDAIEIEKYRNFLDNVEVDAVYAMFFQKELVAIYKTEEALQAAMFSGLYDWDKIELVEVFG